MVYGSIYFLMNDSFDFTTLDHVAIAMPPGEEERAREFYVNVLGMAELRKPEELKSRGGAWFGKGGVQIHLGVDQSFRAAKKAHPAIRVNNYALFISAVSKRGGVVRHDGKFIDGMDHCYIDDPFGNRIELIAAS